MGVHLAVVDPGVGTDRRAIAILASRGDILVGPDNGLLRPAVRALGGIVEARELTNAELFLPRVSSTLPRPRHLRAGRGPARRRAARSRPSVRSSRRSTLVDLVLPVPVARDGGLDSVVVFIDPFGNVRLAGGRRGPRADRRAAGTGRPLRVEDQGRQAPARPDVGRNVRRRPAPGTAIAYDDAETARPRDRRQPGVGAPRSFGLALDDVARIEPV